MTPSDDPRCPVCHQPVRPVESSGVVDGKLAHLACWIEHRENARRAPPPSASGRDLSTPDCQARVLRLVRAAPLCLPCVALMLKLTQEDVRAELVSLSGFLVVTFSNDRCARCQEWRPIAQVS